MCLGVPGEVIGVHREDDVLMGKVTFGGITKNVCMEHVPDAVVGDFVLVHVGFALAKIDRDEAARVFSLLAELDMLDEVNGP